MEQRVSVVTLGARDLQRARRFYEALGWKTNAEPGADIVFFQAGPLIVALWARTKLAKDSGVSNDPGYGGITLAHCVRSPDEVDAVMREATSAGTVVTRKAAATFWGGYSGVFCDPDGHPWEVAYNAHWTLGEDGWVRLN